MSSSAKVAEGYDGNLGQYPPSLNSSAQCPGGLLHTDTNPDCLQGTKQVMEAKAIQQSSLWGVTGTMLPLPDPLSIISGTNVQHYSYLSPSCHLGIRSEGWTPSLQTHFQQTLGETEAPRWRSP